MANIEVNKVAEQLNHRVLYSVKVNAEADHMEFPIGIQDQGSATANETAVLTSRSLSPKRSRQRRDSGWEQHRVDNCLESGTFVRTAPRAGFSCSNPRLAPSGLAGTRAG